MPSPSILFIPLFFLLALTEQRNAGIERSNEGTRADINAALKSIASDMVNVDGSSFMMGNNDGRKYEKPVHSVTLSSFSISRYLVTQAQWQAVMGDNPSDHKGCANCPAEEVNYYDALDFIYKLNKLTGLQYHLPTEAQWEYAARGGNKSHGYEYSGSNDLNAVAWYKNSSGMVSHEVGGKKPNELGLYDMSGNMWEWCKDFYNSNYYASSPSVNPQGPFKGKYPILRGGSWLSDSTNCTVFYRFCNAMDYCSGRVGFRLARD